MKENNKDIDFGKNNPEVMQLSLVFGNFMNRERNLSRFGSVSSKNVHHSRW